MRYAIIGFEVAPNTGTPHLQGFIWFWNAVARSTVSRMFPTAWIESAAGSPWRNYEYCSKTRDVDDTPNRVMEVGPRPLNRPSLAGAQAGMSSWYHDCVTWYL